MTALFVRSTDSGKVTAHCWLSLHVRTQIFDIWVRETNVALFLQKIEMSNATGTNTFRRLTGRFSYGLTQHL